MEDAIRKAAALIEALPYIQSFRGKPVVIKFGGNAMQSDATLADALEDIVFLAAIGIRAVVVHGGGPQISRAMAEAGLSPQFVRGHRVTDAQTLQLVVRVLGRQVNQRLVRGIEEHGGVACSTFQRGRSLLRVRKKTTDDQQQPIDLGYVGEVVSVEPRSLLQITAEGAIAVVPPIGQDDAGQLYNVNADAAAGAVAAALQAEKLVLLSNVHGIRGDSGDPHSFLSTVNEQQVKSLIAAGVIRGGMLPKVGACLRALDAGVRKAHIIDGRLEHSLLLEIFTDKGVGTQILKQ
ncbi:MAG: acetylglutamate kinase [Planctomycetes bacterium]|nr:acetylglutamate kinase [Planctomycetota bacterium]